jgi:hypothetical protein
MEDTNAVVRRVETCFVWQWNRGPLQWDPDCALDEGPRGTALPRNEYLQGIACRLEPEQDEFPIPSTVQGVRGRGRPIHHGLIVGQIAMAAMTRPSSDRRDGLVMSEGEEASWQIGQETNWERQ